MKRKKIIPLLLAVSLSSSVFNFATRAETANEASNLSNDFLSGIEAFVENENTNGQDTGFTDARSAVDQSNDEEATLTKADETNDTSPTGNTKEEHFEEENPEEGLYPSWKEYFAFEDMSNKDEFYDHFGKVLEPVEVPEYLDEEKYYRADNPAVYGLDPQNPSRLILNSITQALRENIDSNILDEEAYGGILPFREAGGNMTPVVGIRFKKFDNGEKLAYVVWQLKGEGPKVLIPLKGTVTKTFSFFVSGNVNQFNLPRNKAICDHNMGEIISFLKKYNPEVKDLQFTDRNVHSEGKGTAKRYYYNVEYTTELGESVKTKVYVMSDQDITGMETELTLFIGKNIIFPFKEGRFDENTTLTGKEVADIKALFSRIKNNVLTGILDVDVNRDIVHPIEGPIFDFGHGESSDYGIRLTVKTEKHGDMKIVVPVTFAKELSVNSVLPVEKADLEQLSLSKDKKFVFKDRNSSGESLKTHLNSLLNSGESLGNPELKIRERDNERYNKEILYPVLKDRVVVRTLKINLNDKMSEAQHYHMYIHLNQIHYDETVTKDELPRILITEEDKKDIEKVLRAELGDTLQSVDLPNEVSIEKVLVDHPYDPDDPGDWYVVGTDKYVKATLHFADGSSREVSVYVTGKLEQEPDYGVPIYRLESDQLCGGEVIYPKNPETPNDPTNPVTPVNPVNPVNPGSGNGGGNSGGGSDPRTPIVNEGETPTVLSASRDNDPSPAGPEVSGAVKEEVPTVLGVARRGLVNTVDSANPFALSLFGLSATGLLFWALEEKKKRA